MSSLCNTFRNSLLISRNRPSSLSSLLSFTDTNNTNYPSSITTTTATRHISSNRSKRGLYDGKDIRSGNNVSFSMKKTKRKFKPNVFRKRLYSEMLDEMIQFHVTTSALRTIDKYGGLDNYLLRSRHVKDGQGQGGAAKKRLLSHINYCKKNGLDVLPDVTLKTSADAADDVEDAASNEANEKGTN